MPNLPLENFDQSEASFQSHMTTMEASDWSKFSDGKFWSNFDPDVISKKNLKKTNF